MNALKVRKYALLKQYVEIVEKIRTLENQREQVKGAISYIDQMIKEGK